MADEKLQSLAFPTLDDTQMETLVSSADAVLKTYKDGEIVFDSCVETVRLYLVKSGELDVFDRSGDAPKIVTTHRRGQFSGDTSVFVGAISGVNAIAHGDCELYEISPDNLRRALNDHPAISDIVLTAFMARRQMMAKSPDYIGLQVFGSRYSADTFRIRDFLAKNRVLMKWIDIEGEPDVDRMLKRLGVKEDETPVVVCGRKPVMRNPSNKALADLLGIHRPLEDIVYDLVVVGAGRAGLAAAVYAASEGLQTAVLEHVAAGGQAGSSMRIENYLGFPTGLTGAELASRATMQAAKFGANLSIPSIVTGLTCEQGYPVTHFEDGKTVVAKALIVATGAEYRQLEVEGCSRFIGTGVYYAATTMEARICRGSPVVIVGGGNSAGQAAVFLADYASKVIIAIRGDDLNKNMSSYLVRRIETTPNIEVLYNTTIARMDGDDHLACVDLLDGATGQERSLKTPAVFSFIGASPRTGWLPDDIKIDSKGFVLTGPALGKNFVGASGRPPFLLETSHTGVFAAGDVRSGSVKRVASAVGEGSMAVQFVHEYLKEI